MTHPDEPPPEREKPSWVRELDELALPEAQAWHKALMALRTINEQTPVEALDPPVRDQHTAA